MTEVRNNRYAKLAELRADVRRSTVYRLLCCCHTADKVSKETGMGFRAGYFFADGEKTEHAWNYDPETDEIVDLTIGQTILGFPEILIVSRNSEIGRQYMTFTEWRKSQGKPVYNQSPRIAT